MSLAFTTHSSLDQSLSPSRLCLLPQGQNLHKNKQQYRKEQSRRVVVEVPCTSEKECSLQQLLEAYRGFPSGSNSKRICPQCRQCGFHSRVRKIPWSREWQPTPVFLPGKSQWQRSLAGYSPRGHKESDMSELLNNRKQTRLNQFVLITIHGHKL